MNSNIIILIKKIAVVVILILVSEISRGQTFLNPDLDGIISGFSSLPNYWQSVPASDPICQALLLDFNDTPDLLDVNDLQVPYGIMGNPYSGNTFLSGLRSVSFHEGIMQTVSGFVPGNSYKVNFWQSVVKQGNSLDQSGSWSIYVDTTLAGISTPTFSSEPYNSTSFVWENREITFFADSTIHTIKLLPEDDDLNNWSSWDDINGSLRMGIDNIQLLPVPCNLEVNLGNDTTMCQGDSLLIDVTTSQAAYLWQDGSNTPTFNLKQQGTYWVEIMTPECIRSDTIVIQFEDCNTYFELPNVFTPNNDGHNDLFEPLVSENIVSLSTTIYNRWGNKIFETENIKIEWDGYDVVEGTYFWVVRYTDIYGKVKSLSGNVTLIRD